MLKHFKILTTRPVETWLLQMWYA